jgi:hypothetical protein
MCFAVAGADKHNKKADIEMVSAGTTNLVRFLSIDLQNRGFDYR